MRKILRVVPFVLFLVIFIWGFININIQNTEVFNSEYIECNSSNKIGIEELEENTGIDFSGFNKDESLIKVYNEENNLKLVFKDYVIDLNEGVLGRIVMYIVNSMNNSVNYINTLIENLV